MTDEKNDTVVFVGLIILSDMFDRVLNTPL